MIAVVDYGMGNLRSVSKALEHLKADVKVTSDPADIERAEKVILPGVGAFGAAMEELKQRGLTEPLQAAIASGKPYLGICLGLQLLFEDSEENPGVPGLGVLAGTVKRFSFNSSLVTGHSSLKIPHMGWNQVVRSQRSEVRGQNDCPLLRGIPEKSFFYFVHSYYAEPSDRSLVLLETDYGNRFTSMIWQKQVFATQFHPEKSQTLGLRLLENFVKL